MGRLTFTLRRGVAETGAAYAALVNTPDDKVIQAYVKDGRMKRSDAQLTAAKDYAAIEFSAAATTATTDVVQCSIKSFPQFGSYGYVTVDDAGTRYSTIIRDI